MRTLADIEKIAILTRLVEKDNHRGATAASLGIGIRTLSLKLKQWGLTKLDTDGVRLVVETLGGVPITPNLVVEFVHPDPGSDIHYPFKNGDHLLCLGEIINMPGHVAVVTKSGQVCWAYDADHFKKLSVEET